MQPSPGPDLYAALRQAILEDDERDAKTAKLLKERAKAQAERQRCIDGQTDASTYWNGWGALIGELDWTAELHLIDVELFINAEENHLP